MRSYLQGQLQPQNLRKLLTFDSLIKGTVFGCAGTTCMYTVPKIISALQELEFVPFSSRPKPYPFFGDNPSFRDGPWLFRLMYVSVSMAVYNVSLIFWGCMFGRGKYFLYFSLRMWARIFPST